MGEKTIEIKMDEFIRLCRVDARMEALIAYIKSEKNGFVKLDTVKTIIGIPDKPEEPSVWDHEELAFEELGITQHKMHKRHADNYNAEERENAGTEI